MKGVVGAAVVGTALLPVLAVVSVVTTGAGAAAACLPATVQVTGSVPASARLDAGQRANARTIVGAAVARRLPTRAAVIAVATALQESGLRNLPYGDRDSLGLFQQRPSQGWGTPAEVLDPARATDAFLDGLEEVRGWQALPLTEAAQAVQRSAFPDAYAKWEDQARVVVAGLLERPDPGGVVRPAAVTDTPGLLVLGDDLLAGSVTAWPATFNGGPVSVDVRPGRAIADGLDRLRDRSAELPGTLVVSLGADIPDRTAGDLRLTRADLRTRAGEARAVRRILEQVGARAGAVSRFGGQVRAVLAATGSGRSVHWLTSPDPAAKPANAALRAIAGEQPRLHLIDVAAAVRKHPGWSRDGALTASGVTGVAGLVRRTVAAEPAADPTAAVGPGCDDGLGGYADVPVGDCTFQLPRTNPRGCQDAVRWALAQVDGPAVWYRRCLNFVARAHGWSASGVPDAARFWAGAPVRHPGAGDPPAGALVFWDTGDPAGHVALSAGGGQVVSNDIGGAGTIATVPLERITARWGATYLGWAPPFFPDAV